MVILHIASIDNDPFSGVPNAVPTIVNAQARKLQSVHESEERKNSENSGEVLDIDSIGFLNVRDKNIERISVQIKRHLSIRKLEAPFDKPDIVIFHEVYYPAFIPLGLECRRRKIKYVIVPHGCLTKDTQNIKSFKKKLGNSVAFASFIMNAEALQFLSEKEKKSTVFNKKGFVCPTGIILPEIEHSEADRCRDRTGQPETIRFTYIGRIDPYIKGLDILIDAIGKERDYLIKEKCLFSIYGKIVDEKAVSDLKQSIKVQNVSNLVRICGPVQEKEKCRIFRNTDVFILTSRSEALPTGVMEALSFGVPCMVSKGTGLADIIENYNAGWGERIRKDKAMDEEEKRNGISELLLTVVMDVKSGAILEKSKKARLLAVEEFDCIKAAGKAIEVYRKLSKRQ